MVGEMMEREDRGKGEERERSNLVDEDRWMGGWVGDGRMGQRGKVKGVSEGRGARGHGMWIEPACRSWAADV